MDASKAYYRFVVLFFNCMLTFGTAFCFDMPSVLQAIFQGNITCINATTYGNSSDCVEGLGMTPNQYNLLYAIYAWTNAIVVIAAGFLIDKLGNQVGLFLFSGLCLIGSSTFAGGAMLKGTKAMLPMMLIGRLIFGSGNGSLIIVRNRITAYWFKDKELAFAFGVTLTFVRLGSVLNFLLTKSIEDKVGLTWVLWGGAFLCALGFTSAIVTSILDIYGVRQLGQESNVKQSSKKLHFSDIRYFNSSYWLVVLTIMFFYNGVFPFMADASKFIHDKYGFKEESPVPSYLVGAVFDVSLVLCVLLGALIDIIGMRGLLALFCSVATIPVFGLLAFTHIYPLVSTLWLGFTYSIASATLWSSIPLVVTQETVGMAMGFATSAQMIGVGICNNVIGAILGNKNTPLPHDELMKRWKYVMIFLFANTLCCVVTAILLNLSDKRKGCILNQNRRERREGMALLMPSVATDDGSGNSTLAMNEAKPLLHSPDLGRPTQLK
ncbi:major facilitator superfamily domain-containing protein 1-like isoform X3 [Acanthaster planci]|uniref:Lysosomal dipeptide transporter MFSD1 n=1 Tax=Acanthaster planci TaxID=133434 RepID=A0A8B7Y1J1_ACAPL|nr:major facilitator superfamily domain-containing protein 1-like isoform X3 [Acanthaster planci]